ncbi:MAG TPA: ribosomal protein S18-alanine N-acetyltransferase [Telluria sp.]
MSTAHALDTLVFAPMRSEDLDEVVALEQSVYPYPWTRPNFADSLSAGYEAWVVRDEAGKLAGYFLAMWAVDEAHLLNVAVAAGLHGQGIGRCLLDKLSAIAREHGMESILLEVRPSNERALKVYRHYGYTAIGVRKGYYPAGPKGREDAIVMRYTL